MITYIVSRHGRSGNYGIWHSESGYAETEPLALFRDIEQAIDYCEKQRYTAIIDDMTALQIFKDNIPVPEKLANQLARIVNNTGEIGYRLEDARRYLCKFTREVTKLAMEAMQHDR